MLLLTAVQSSKPDYVALAMVAVIAVIVAVMAIRKRFTTKKPVSAPVETAAPAAEKEKALAPGSAGEVKLYTVDPRTAAMLMAIVAERTGKPLNELRFISIREVE